MDRTMFDGAAKAMMVLLVMSHMAAIGLGLIIGTARYGLFAQDDYKQGQIDAANGVMKYELKQLPTGETVWVKKGTE